METLIQALKAINDVIWGPGMLILLIGTGLYLTVGLRFYTFRNIFSAFSMLWKGRTSSAGDKGELTPFNALMTALAGTIGTGSIVGVATAILSGGPGALFWMWCTAMVGMATKFSEILLAVRYREVTPAGNFVGGAMYFIKNGLGEKWKWLGGLFAIFAAITCFGTGNAVQTNAISPRALGDLRRSDMDHGADPVSADRFRPVGGPAAHRQRGRENSALHGDPVHARLAAHHHFEHQGSARDVPARH